MTTKSKTQGGSKGKGSDVRGAYDALEDPQNCLTQSEVSSLLGHLHYYLAKDGNPEPSELFVLLIHSLAAEEDGQTRANFYEATLRWFARDLGEVYAAQRVAITRVLEDFREGGAR